MISPRPALLVCLLVFAARFCATAASVSLQIADVFTAGQDGYHTYRIPAIVVTTNGTALAFCEGRKNSRSDAGDIDLLLKRSTDGGKTWSAPQVIWSDATNTCGNPAPVVDRITGIVWLLMTWNLGVDKEDGIIHRKARDTRRVFITSSADDGRTWAPTTEITSSVKRPDWGWYATGPGNGIQLTRAGSEATTGSGAGATPATVPAGVPLAGRLLIPCNHSMLTSAMQSLTRSHLIFSDDHGKTWRIGGVEEEKTNESTIVELGDGSLLHNMRSYHGQNRRAVARSQDGGLTWSPVKLDDTLIEPVCQASILRCTWPDGGEKNRILFSNPASTKREKLTIRASYDDGATWTAGRILQPGPAAYSCLVMLPDKTIGCLFERGEKSPYEKISLARFPLRWLEE
jgi:sialidase-1